MKRVLVIAAASLAFAGCSDLMDEMNEPRPVTEAFHDFLVAISDGNGAAMWEEVSANTKKRLTRERFGKEVVPALQEHVPQGTNVPDVDELFGDEFFQNWGVSAAELETPEGAFALPVRREGERWRVEPYSGPLKLVAGPPEPGADLGLDGRVGFGVYTRDPDVLATMWIDGVEQELRGAGGPSFTRYWAEAGERLTPGSHAAVVLVRADGGAAALAWTFSAGLAG